MKIAKKSLSLFLSLLMIFTACSVGFTGFTFTAAAATGTAQSVKDALTDHVVNEIVYKGTLSFDSYIYKGDPAVLAAAEEIYAYAMSFRTSDESTADNNTTTRLLQLVSEGTGYTDVNSDKYKALQYIIDPPGSVITPKEDNHKKDGGTHDELSDGFLGMGKVDHKYSYPTFTLPTQSSLKTVKIYTSLNALLEKYGSVDAIPTSLLQGVEYIYAQVGDQACIDIAETSGSGCSAKTVYRCWGWIFNYLATVQRKEIKNIVSIDELKQYGETLASADLSMTFEEMVALPAAELEAIYNENYAPYQAMIDKYTFANVEKLFGSYNQYFRDLLNAMQINLALPAIDILMDKVGTAYDSTNYDEMSAIYYPTNSAYNAVKGYGSKVFDYIKAKAEYADFELSVAKEYLNDIKEAMDRITLPDLKATIDADIAAYADVDLNGMDIPVLKTLLGKLNGYKGTINASNSSAVNNIMGITVNNLNNLISAVKTNIDTRSPADTEAAYQAQYNYFTPVLFGNYSAMSTADVMAMYADYQVNYDALIAAYDEQVAKYGTDVVNPLFSVTIGEGGTPTLIQDAVDAIGTTGMQADLTARNSEQLAIAAGYKDMAGNVNFDNLVEISTGIKNFNQALYDLCAAEENNWVSDNDKALYSDVSAVITAFNEFVNKINSEGFQKIELDENGVYVVRDVYEEDLVKEEAYEVTESKLNDTIVKLDTFLASKEFGALVGLEDANGDAVGLGDYIYGMLGDLLFNNDLINQVIGMLFPMIEDLLNNQLGPILAEEVSGGKNPVNPAAVGYVDFASLGDSLPVSIEGGLDVYLGDIKKGGQDQVHYNFPTLLKNAGLYIFPDTLADSMVTSGVLKTSDETYKVLKEAGNSWNNLGVFDEQTETFTFNVNLDWGITDKDSFIKVLGGVLDSVGSLLPTLFLNTPFEKTLDNAGMGYGSIKALSIVSINSAEFYANLGLTLQPLNLYSTLIQPLFKLLGLDANANLNNNSKGIDYAKAILEPIFGLLDKVVAAPLDTILGILPSLAYILSTDFIDSFLGKLVLDVVVSIGISGSNASGLFATLLDWLSGSLSFPVMEEKMGIADIAGAATLKDLVGIDISNINSLLDFLFEKLGVTLELPDIDQTALVECAKWNSASSLTADKADVLFFLLDYLVSALKPELLDAIIGLVGGEDSSLDLEGTLGTVLNTVIGNIRNNPDDAIAAIVELLNPVEYELKEMTAVEGAAAEIVYLHYANDWTKTESQYIIDNAMDIVATVLEMTGSEVTDINAFLKEKVDGLLGGLFTNETVTSLVETLAGIGDIPEILNDILVGELGVDITAWANDFGYLFDETLTAPEATVLGVTVAEVDGALVWNGMADGDKDAFIDTLCALLAPLAPAVAFLLGGEDLDVFGVVELKGYESFDSTLGLLLETLGVTVPEVDFAAEPMAALKSVIDAVFAWLDATLASDNLVETAIDLVADLVRYIDSNGLAVLLNNLLLPVLALVDTVRPLVNVDVNTILSVIVSDLIRGNGLDMNKIKQILVGSYEGNNDIIVTITIDSLTFIDILKIVDAMLGSNLVGSSFATIGVKGLCDADVDTADALTIILSSLIDALTQPAADESLTNAQAIFGFVAEKTGNEQIPEIVMTVLDLIEGIVYEYSAPNWGYMFGLDEEFNTVLPEHSIAYLGYTNNWTKESADATYAALEKIVAMVLDSALEEGETIATLLNGILEDNVYSDEILNTVVELLVNLLADLDATLFDLVDVVVNTNIAEWFTFCTFNEESGEYECTKEWGIDEAADKKATFIAAIKEVLAPANQLLAWLFFGDSYEFLTDSEVDAEGNYTYKSLITLNGGEGYNKALVPIFEALGVEMKTAGAYLVDGKYDVTLAIEDIFNALLALVDKVSAAPAEEVFKLLPNLIYFLNADGIKSSVNNLLVPVNAIIAKLSPVVGDVSIGALLEEQIGFDITDITMDTLLGLAADAGFVMSDKMVNLIKTFYIGELEEYTSVNGDLAYRMVYTDEESAGDMLTIVLSLALEFVKLNGEKLEELLGMEGIADVLEAYLTGGEVVVLEMQEFDWKDTDKADSGEIFSPIEAEDSHYDYVYGDLYTREQAEYINKWLPEFVDTTITLIGYQNAEGENVENLGELLQDLVGTSIYTTDLLNTILDALKGLLGTLKDELGADLFAQVATILKSSLGVDVSVWETLEIAEVNGNREAFVAELTKILSPAEPILEWLFTSKALKFFNDSEGKDLVVIAGAEGYAYGIIPLLEALGCDQDDILTPDEYASSDDLLGNILNPLLNRVDALLADPVNELVGMLPGLIYFINSNGLDTVFKNTLRAVISILENIEPLAEVDLYELIGIDLSEVVDMETLISMILDLAAGDSELVTIPMDVVSELTLGTVKSFTSKNGETAYTMEYAPGADETDLVTTILRLVLEFVSVPENVETIEALLVDNLSDEGYKFLCSLLENFSQMAATEDGMDAILYTVYQIFYTANVAAKETEDFMGELNDDYTFLGNLFATSDLDFIKNIGASLGGLLDNFMNGDIIGSEGIAQNGLMKFFQAIADFFQKIIDFFMGLFA